MVCVDSGIITHTKGCPSKEKLFLIVNRSVILRDRRNYVMAEINKRGKRPSTIEGEQANAPNPLGDRVRQLRQDIGYSLRQLADVSGISYSAISKIENNQLSPTYDSLVRLAKGLQCDIVDLFHEPAPQAPSGRRSITRKGQGIIYRTANYDYELLCNDLTYKKITPLRVTVKANSVQTFGSFSQHEGEEMILVLSGTVEVHTQYYQPEILHEGDCMYFDSTMEHACLNKGDVDAVVFWISSSPTIEDKIVKMKA